jgi:hypothetical protein
MTMPHSLPADECDLLERAGRWPTCSHWRDLTEEALRQITVEEGADFATAVLYQRLIHSPEYGPFLARLEAVSESTAPRPLAATVVIVPGAFYAQHPETGADGRRVREVAERFGCRTELIRVASVGSPAHNGRIICDWLSRWSGGPIILASLSKGGADVRCALTEPGAERAFRDVVVWINLSGMVYGTPLIDWVFARRLRTWWFRLLFRLRGYDFRVLPDLARGPGTLLAADFRLPGRLRAIHVVGLPLARHLTRSLARRAYRRLLPLGPSDGAGMLLADIVRLPGLVYPVWGADHYLRPAGRDLRDLAHRLLLYLSEEWDTLVGQSAVERAPVG